MLPVVAQPPNNAAELAAAQINTNFLMKGVGEVGKEATGKQSRFGFVGLAIILGLGRIYAS
jgi:hypothetical protein